MDTDKRLLSRKWRVWLAGIAQGMIHGAATTAGAMLGIGAANVVGANVPAFTYKQLGSVMLAGSVSGGIAYLRTAPWPKEEDETTHIPKPPA